MAACPRLMEVLAMYSIRLAIVLCFVALVTSLPSESGDMSPISVDSHRIAIGGYDPVAYFTVGKAVQGTSQYEYVWKEASWWFASDDHRAMFVANPYRYTPQFGGFCASAMAVGMLTPANPEAWVIIDDKLYILDAPATVQEWKANAVRYIPKASAVYEKQVGP
jgi:hypothetical protein